MDLNDLLVYADWVEDEGKDTFLLRDTIYDFDCFIFISENSKKRIHPLRYCAADAGKYSSIEVCAEFNIELDGDGMGDPIDSDQYYGI